MNRETFLKLSSATVAAHLLPPFKSWAQQERLKNWAGNITYSTSNVFYPASVEEVQDLVRKCNRLRALGTRHCFNRIADSKDNLVSTAKMKNVVSLDKNAGTVTVEGGIKYGELCPYLHEQGFALHNLASLPHISVAGSCSTATHGSGMKNGNLATAVNALEIVTADGNIVHLSRDKDGEKFLGAVVGLGALGIITKATLDIQPTFLMKQNVYERMPVAQMKAHFDEIMSAGYSVSLFTDWQGDTISEVWIKTRVDEGADSKHSGTDSTHGGVDSTHGGTDSTHGGTDLNSGGKDYNKLPEFFGAKAATKNMHPIAGHSAENCTEQMGVAGPWYERLPHFKMGFTPSSGQELQSEYFVPHQHAVEAILAVTRLADKISPLLLITEIRTIAADHFWMSPCRNQASVTIHFTWKPEWDKVKEILPLIENQLAPFNARPHWGKLFTLSPGVLASRYEKLPDFKKLVAAFDPNGKFRNEFLNSTIYA
jgi:alditol oxidase